LHPVGVSVLVPVAVVSGVELVASDAVVVASRAVDVGVSGVAVVVSSVVVVPWKPPLHPARRTTATRATVRRLDMSYDRVSREAI